MRLTRTKLDNLRDAGSEQPLEPMRPVSFVTCSPAE